MKQITSSDDYKVITDKFLAKFEQSWGEIFEVEWNKLISSYDFRDLCQLNNGNRLRAINL